ncbi:hypothetical protein HDU76_003828, partial [Blyttiomyces sp. JEL0837]
MITAVSKSDRAPIFQQRIWKAKPVKHVSGTFSSSIQQLESISIDVCSPLPRNFRGELSREGDKTFEFFEVRLEGDKESEKLANVKGPKETFWKDITLRQPLSDPNPLIIGDLCFASLYDRSGLRRPWIESGYLHVEHTSMKRIKVEDGSNETLFWICYCRTWNLDFDPNDPQMFGRNIFVSTFSSAVGVNRVLNSLSNLEWHQSFSPAMTRALFLGERIAVKEGELHSRTFDTIGFDALNESEKQAVSEAVSTTRTRGFCLIQGPPGTGKTSTIVVLIATLLAANQTIMQCASTNIALLEVAKRFIAKYSSMLPHYYILILSSDRQVVEHITDDTLERFSLPGVIRYYCDSVRRFFETIGDPINHARERINDLEEFDPERQEDIESLALLRLQTDVALDQDLLKTFAGMKNSIEREGDEKLASKLNKGLGPFLAAHDMHLLLRSETATFKEIARAHQDFVLVHLRFLPSQEASNTSFNDSSKNLTSKQKASRKFIVYSEDQLILHQMLEIEILRSARVVFCTLNTTMSRPAQMVNPSVVIVDEAAQAVEAEMTGIISRGPSVKAIVMVGDTKQLPGTVLSPLAIQVNYRRSLFERLEVLGFPKTMLDIQYRMHPAISLFPSSTFYHGMLIDGQNVVNYHQPWYNNEEFGSVQFIGHRGTKHFKDNAKSSFNPEEAVSCLEQLVGQIKKYPGVDISVKTVDGFQGQERDLVIVSLTNTERAGKFADDEHRKNVGITRAKYGLWVFGDEQAFKNQNFGIVKELQASISSAKEVSPESLFAKSSFHVWEVIATDKIRHLLIRNLRFGRPYRKSGGFAGKMFYNRRIDGQSVLAWTIGVRDGHQVILLSADVDVSSGLNVAVPRSNIEVPTNPSAKTPFESIARDVTNSGKLYDLSSSGLLNSLLDADDETDESFRLVLPYLLEMSIKPAPRGGYEKKTSILARKLYNLYEAALEQELPPFRQLFISQSRLLVANVKSDYQELVMALHKAKNIPLNDQPPGEQLGDQEQIVSLPLTVDFGDQGSSFLSFMDLIFKMDQVLGHPRLFTDAESERKAVRSRLIGETRATSTSDRKSAVTIDD